MEFDQTTYAKAVALKESPGAKAKDTLHTVREYERYALR
jgi:hypothetical protein